MKSENKELNNFLEKNKAWSHRQTYDDYIDIDYAFYSDHAPSGYEDLYVDIILSIDTYNEKITYAFLMNDAENGVESDAKMNVELIRELEVFINNSLDMLSKHFPSYIGHKFSIYESITNIEKNVFLSYIKPVINDLVDNKTPLMCMLAPSVFYFLKDPVDFISTMITHGADPYIENTDGDSFISMLIDGINQDALEVLKQKILLDKMVDHQEFTGMSL